MIKSKLRVITGLHIGGSDDTMNIGGIDSSVVKREIYANSNGSINYDGSGQKVIEPYIPGSSLKGKIRSLLEHHFGLIAKQRDLYENHTNNKKRKKVGQVIDSEFIKDCDNKELEKVGMDSEFIKDCDNKKLKKKAHLIVTLFGESAGGEERDNIKITRAIFRDSFLTEDSRRLYLEKKIALSEEKAENTINRVTVMPNPRFMERVPAGVEFNFEVVIRNFTEDNNLPLKKTIELGLKLLENDALGGGGSRGNGKIEFEIFEKGNRDITTEIEDLTSEIEESL